jgi:A/G-specific adenine glycosylase
MAFGLPEPLVDGNVARVLSRMFLIKGDWRKGETKEKLWSIARELVSHAAAPGDHNESMMELGATVCTPTSPDCARCPVAAFCQAKARGLQSKYPETPEKKKVPSLKLTAWIVEDKHGRILLARREESGLFGGLWEVPMERDAAPESKPLARVVHVLTHRELKIGVHRHAQPDSFTTPESFYAWSGSYTQFRWLSAKDALQGDELGLPSVQRKVIDHYVRYLDSFHSSGKRASSASGSPARKRSSNSAGSNGLR